MKRLRRLVIHLRGMAMMFQESAPKYAKEQADLLEKARADLAKIEALVLGSPK